MPECDICHKYFKTKSQKRQLRTKEHTKKISSTRFRIPEKNFDLCKQIEENKKIQKDEILDEEEDEEKEEDEYANYSKKET